MMNIFVTGACGYKGSVLVPKLLRLGHRVTGFDIQWFGNHLEPHPDLTIVKGDVRNPDEINLDGIDAIIHLSSVANDPCGDLDPKLTWEISCLATERKRPTNDLNAWIAFRLTGGGSRGNAIASVSARQPRRSRAAAPRYRRA